MWTKYHHELFIFISFSVTLSLEISSFSPQNDFLSAPKLSNFPSSLNYFSNSIGITLTCESSSTSKDSHPLSLSTTVTFTDSSGLAILNIPGVREHLQNNGSLHIFPFEESHFLPSVHNGDYRCSVRNPVGTYLSPLFSIRAIIDRPFQVAITLQENISKWSESFPLLSCEISPSLYSPFKKVLSWKEMDRYGHAKQINFDHNQTRYAMNSCDGSLLILLSPQPLEDKLFLCVVENVLNKKIQSSSPFLFKAKSKRNGQQSFPLEKALNSSTVIIQNICEKEEKAQNYLENKYFSDNLTTGEISRTVRITELICLANGEKDSTSKYLRWKKYDENINAFLSLPDGYRGWVDDHYIFQVGSFLRILSFEEISSTGKYQCEIEINEEVEDETYFANYSVSGESRNLLRIQPERISTMIGENVEYFCGIDGDNGNDTNNIPLEFLWLKSGKPLVQDGDMRTTVISNIGRKSHLKIFNVQFEDQGIFQCFSKEKMAFAQLIFPFSPPKLLHKFTSLNVQPESNISMKCSAIGNPSPEINWFIDSLKINNFHHRFSIEERISSHSGEITSFLNVSKVNLEDSGLYSCTATNQISSLSHFSRLNVYGKLFVKEMELVTFPQGNLIHLPCPYGGFPVDDISWEKNGSRITSKDNSNSKYFLFPNGTLQIEQISQNSDQGTFTCKVSNKKGESASNTVIVNVMRPPVISHFKFDDDLKEGDRTAIPCSVINGDLPIQISWQKDGKDITSGLNLTENKLRFLNVLMFDDLREEHSGTYTCSTANLIKTVKQSANLIVKIPPKWKRHKKKNYKALLKGDIILNCEASGVPLPKITWFKDRNGTKMEIMPTSKFTLGQNGTLKINKVEISDAANYICKAYNNVGQSISKLITLEVITPPKASAVQNIVTVGEGGLAALQCQISGDQPVAVTWKRIENGKSSTLLRKTLLKSPTDKYFTEKVTQINSTVFQAQLSIYRVSISQSGYYLCSAANQFGRDEAQIKLEVKARPFPPDSLKVGEIGSRFIRLRWSPPSKDFVDDPVTHFILQWRKSIQNEAFNEEYWNENNEEANLFSEKSKEKVIFNMTVDFPSSQAILGSLSPVTFYKIRLFSCNKIGISLPTASLSVLTLPEAPSGPPQNVSVNLLTPKSILVKWQPPEELLQHGTILGYKIAAIFQSALQIIPSKLEKNNETVIFEEKWEQQSELKGLQPNSQYRVAVKAYNVAGVGPESPPVFIQTPEGAPDSPPLNLQCDSLSPKSLQVQWDPPPVYLSNGQIIGYKVFYNKNPTNVASFSFGREKGEVKKTSNRETTLHGLESYQNYTVKVLAFTSGGESDPTQPVNCRTEEDVPGEPADIKVLASGLSSFLVSWLPPSSPNGLIRKYTIFWRAFDDNAVIKEKHFLPSSALSAFSAEYQLSTEICKLKENQEYTVWITATTSAGAGLSSRSESVYLPEGGFPSYRIPARIASFPVTTNVQIGHQSLQLPCKFVGSPQPKITWLKDSHLPISPRQLRNGSIFISKVKAEDKGEYNCRVENKFGSDSIQHRIIISTAPSAVQQFSIGYVTDTSLHCHWEPPVTANPPISAYILEHKQQNSEWKSIKLSNILTSYTIEGLFCGSHYDIRLTAENPVGKGESSPILQAKTNGHSPSSSPHLTDILNGNGTIIQIYLDKWPDGDCPLKYIQVQYKKLETGSYSWKQLSKQDTITKLVTFGSQDPPYSKYQIKIKVENDAGSVEKTFFIENHPDFFKNYLSLKDLTTEKVGESSRSGNITEKNGHSLPYMFHPHIVVPIISGVICTLAIAACILIIILRKKNNSSKTDCKLNSSLGDYQQSSWISTGERTFPREKVNETFSDFVDNQEENLAIYSTIKSGSSTVRHHNFNHPENNYDSISPPSIYLIPTNNPNPNQNYPQNNTKNRKKSIRSSSSTHQIPENNQIFIEEGHFDFLHKITEPPQQFRSIQCHQNIYHYHHSSNQDEFVNVPPTNQHKLKQKSSRKSSRSHVNTISNKSAENFY